MDFLLTLALVFELRMRKQTTCERVEPMLTQTGYCADAEVLHLSLFSSN